MEIAEAIKVLEEYNKWRRGAEIKMEEPAKLGVAIDLVLRELKNYRMTQKWVCESCGAEQDVR